jgi:hypothetical protein
VHALLEAIALAVVFFGVKTSDSLVGTATRGVGSEKKTTAEAMASGGNGIVLSL